MVVGGKESRRDCLPLVVVCPAKPGAEADWLPVNSVT